MVWITDHNGRRWHPDNPRKKRKPARALRFAEIKVGDQLMKEWRTLRAIGGEIVPGAQAREYCIVTDLWFDPVAGQSDEVAGQMVAIRRISDRGEIDGRKEPHTKRGLASQGFHYADRDFIAFVKARAEAENVVGISFGRIVRQRPKTPGRHL